MPLWRLVLGWGSFAAGVAVLVDAVRRLARDSRGGPHDYDD